MRPAGKPWNKREERPRDLYLFLMALAASAVGLVCLSLIYLYP